jgi:hypothetical protein
MQMVVSLRDIKSKLLDFGLRQDDDLFVPGFINHYQLIVDY